MVARAEAVPALNFGYEGKHCHRGVGGEFMLPVQIGTSWQCHFVPHKPRGNGCVSVLKGPSPRKVISKGVDVDRMRRDRTFLGWVPQAKVNLGELRPFIATILTTSM
jgi:hypothetical protein